MQTGSDRRGSSKFTPHFSVSPGFEIFLALQNVLGGEAALHEEWRAEARATLPASFFDKVTRLCSNPLVWQLADALGPLTLVGTVDELLNRLASLDHSAFATNVLEGTLHVRSDADALVKGRIDLREAIARAAPEKRDWLAFLELYPFDASAPYAVFLSELITHPDTMRLKVIDVLTEFNVRVFHQTWRRLAGDLKQSADGMRRLFSTTTLEEFARQTLLRIEVDESEGFIRAVRGGYTLPFSEIGEIHFIPSTFNEQRLWNGFEDPQTGKTTAIFPCFDPNLGPTVTADERRRAPQDILADIDAALVFKALGDNTRYAMVRAIAVSPTTAVDLARVLSLSRPTVSHHVQKLRLAGLINEEWSSGSVILSLRREVIEHLSEVAVHALYPD